MRTTFLSRVSRDGPQWRGRGRRGGGGQRCGRSGRCGFVCVRVKREDFSFVNEALRSQAKKGADEPH